MIRSLVLLAALAGGPAVAENNPPEAPIPGVATEPTQERREADRLLRQDRHIRGRITHTRDYAPRERSAIHRERQNDLRDGHAADRQ